MSNHSVTDYDGMKVLVIHQMNKRFDPETGLELPQRKMDDVKVVHSTEIANYYGLPHHDIGIGKERQLGVWSFVFHNMIGQRIIYNTEETEPTDRYIRDWRKIVDSRGVAVDTKEIVKIDDTEHGAYKVREIDDGMYVRLSDLLEYAKVMGWKKGGGFPAGKVEAASEDRMSRLESLVEQLLLAVATGAQKAPSVMVEPIAEKPARKSRVWSAEEKIEAGARLARARAAKKNG